MFRYSCMYEWATRLDAGSTLKKAVDAVICSVCYIEPQFTSCLLHWMGIVPELPMSTSSMTDDLKDSTRFVWFPAEKILFTSQSLLVLRRSHKTRILKMKLNTWIISFADINNGREIRRGWQMIWNRKQVQLVVTQLNMCLPSIIFRLIR